MRPWVRHTLMLSVLVSLAAHLAIWTSLHFTKKDKSPVGKTIEIVVLERQTPKNEPQRMQIVEQTDKALNDETPEDAQYLSKNNQKILKESKAAQTGDFQNSAGKGGVANQNTNHASEKQKPLPSPTMGSLPTLADLRPKFNPTSIEAPAPGAGAPVSQSNDHLKDTPSGLETLLNTREFVYYTYYQRIRSQIRQYWEPSIRQKVKKIFASGRSIASEKDHITRVVIILDGTGNLKGVQVIGESGLRDLDEAAVEAFRAAEPFPNPPKGIIESDGMIRINWDFILEASNHYPTNTRRYAKNP